MVGPFVRPGIVKNELCRLVMPGAATDACGHRADHLGPFVGRRASAGGADALDDLAVRGDARPGAAVSGRAGVPGADVRPARAPGLCARHEPGSSSGRSGARSSASRMIRRPRRPRRPSTSRRCGPGRRRCMGWRSIRSSRRIARSSSVTSPATTTRTARASPGLSSRRRTRCGSTRRARRSCSPSSPAATTRGASPSGTMDISTFPRETPPRRRRPTRSRRGRITATSSRRSCGSMSTVATRARPIACRPTTRSSPRPGLGPRSGPMACATPGGWLLIASAATSGSAMSGGSSGS